MPQKIKVTVTKDHDTREAIRRGKANVGSKTQKAQPVPTGRTVYRGLLKDYLSAPQNWGEFIQCNVQIWEWNGADQQLENTDPNRVVIGYNFDPGFAAPAGTYVRVEYVNGLFEIYWASCWFDATQLAS